MVFIAQSEALEWCVLSALFGPTRRIELVANLLQANSSIPQPLFTEQYRSSNRKIDVHSHQLLELIVCYNR